MKTIMIVPELPCKNCHKYEPNACVECFNKNGKKEQVPENFSELRELCKELNNKIKDIQVSCVYEKHIVIQWYNDDNTDIDVYDDGTIFVENHLVAENRTPQQMYQIIKSLIGEE